MLLSWILEMTRQELRNILVVDDDSSICQLLKDLLNSEDRVVFTANTLGDAREALRLKKIDLVILDLYLPDGNGMDLLLSFKSLNGEAPGTIVMTAFGSWETHVKAHHLGAYYYLDKPFKVTQVRLLVEQALREKTVQ
jgi:DNA-binding NtrC family response regulator